MKCGDKIIAIADGKFEMYKKGDTGKVYSRYNNAITIDLDHANVNGKKRITCYIDNWDTIENVKQNTPATHL